jgi:hypothetical protein
MAGGITVQVAGRGEVELEPGQWLELAVGTAYSALVGTGGVTCAEGSLPCLRPGADAAEIATRRSDLTKVWCV